jgi:multidrug transporter EmrE-like cation transporter
VSAAVNFILTASVAAVFFGEKLAWNNFVGIALIIAGVFVINLKRA